jgi:hypothetical protein
MDVDRIIDNMEPDERDFSATGTAQPLAASPELSLVEELRKKFRRCDIWVPQELDEKGGLVLVAYGEPVRWKPGRSASVVFVDPLPNCAWEHVCYYVVAEKGSPMRYEKRMWPPVNLRAWCRQV